ATSLVLMDLVPGTVIYYARVSARTVLGYGGRRDATPEGNDARADKGIRVPYQVPDAPVSAYYPGGLPALARDAPASLAVSFGAPRYDGGARLANFTVECDTSSNFNSSAGRTPLRSVTVDATVTLCTACVARFDIVALALTLQASSQNFFGQLDAGQRILVGKVYTFTVDAQRLSGATIYVTPDHNALASMTFSPSERLELYGSSTSFPGLQLGAPHYVRVFAANVEMGAGPPAPSPPVVMTMVPAAPPVAPSQVTLSLNAIDSLRARWPSVASASDADRIDYYLVEVYSPSATVSTSGSLFGVREVQRITLGTAPVDLYAKALSTFTLAHGAVDVPLPGTVTATQGSSTLITTEDLTAVLSRGDLIQVGGGVYAVHAYLPFDATTQLPVSAAAYSTDGLVIPELVVGRTADIAYDASALNVKHALEALEGTCAVDVSRSVRGNGYEWLVTFLDGSGAQ
ncbi:hypothetical protein JKP88DRAFT_308697, partial [Tribonema minus]